MKKNRDKVIELSYNKCMKMRDLTGYPLSPNQRQVMKNDWDELCEIVREFCGEDDAEIERRIHVYTPPSRKELKSWIDGGPMEHDDEYDGFVNVINPKIHDGIELIPNTHGTKMYFSQPLHLSKEHYAKHNFKDEVLYVWSIDKNGDEYIMIEVK